MNGLFIFVALLVAYIGVVYALNKFGRLGGALELMGPFLMMRTQRGKPTIEKISKAKRLWAVFGDVGIALVAVAGLLMFAMLVLQLVVFIMAPQFVADNSPSAQYLIGLPGVNPLIPIWYGLFGLIVALVIHEGCHGILSRHAGIRVKSLGVLWFIVPIGAFVEPDEADLERATPRQRLRMFAAGPMSNIVMCTVAGVLFSSVFMASLTVPMEGQGILVTGVEPGYGAEQAGIAPGSVITHVDGEPIPDWAAFNRVIGNKTWSNESRPTALVTFRLDDVTQTVPVNLSSRYEYLMKLHMEGTLPAAPDPSVRNQSFVGVSIFDFRNYPDNPRGPLGSIAGLRDVLQHPFSYGVDGFYAYISYPFFVLGSGMDILNAPYNQYVEVSGPLEWMHPTVFFVLANTLYWLFWLNLMLGTFNALPAGPLDGGQMLRTTLRSIMWRVYGVDRSRVRVTPNLEGPGVFVAAEDEETQRRLDRANGVVRRATMTLGFFILGLILLPIIGPQLVRLFG